MPVGSIRPATAADVAWIVGQEQRSDFAGFIHRFPPEQHQRNLTDADKLYLIAEDEAHQRAGFVMLAGLSSSDRNIELVRMGVAQPGTGIGRLLLMAAMETVFDKLGAHRLWLDVFADNARARHVYAAAGFREQAAASETVLKADGQPGSLVIMSIHAAEYRASNRR